MTVLTLAERQLLLEAAFAGANHGLLRQVRAMLPAMPVLVVDSGTCAVCCAILLVGLGEAEQAQRILAGVNTSDAEMVKHCFSLS